MADVTNRKSWFASLQRIKVIVDALDADTVTLGAVKFNLEQIDKLWTKLEKVQEKILSTCADDTAVNLQITEFVPIEVCYEQIATRLFTLKEKLATTPAYTATFKLPDMALPPFDGKYEDWPTFQDLFTASIHKNPSLSGSQKLQYLKSCMKGEAASLIKSFIITDANYSEAWRLLESQYDNKREIVHSHVKKLLFQPAIKAESPSSLQQMLTTTLESVRSLMVMGRPISHWDDVITVLLIEKFDSDTKSEWAKSLRGTDPPTFQDLQDFMQQHIRTLHARGISKQPISSRLQSSQQGKKISVHHQSITTCHYCQGTHQMYQCSQLKDMAAEKRFAAVQATGVCLNCLQNGHGKRECQSTGSCRKCSKKHNTFLHTDYQKRTWTNPTSTSQQSTHPPQQESRSSEQSSSSSTLRINTASFSAKSPTLLKTALVDVLDSNSVKQSVRVFIDEGGEGCLIREASMHQLGLKKEKVDVTVVGVGDKILSHSHWKANVRLHSQVNNSAIDVELYAVHKVSDMINKLEAGSPKNWSHIAGLQLADPQFHEGGEIDILLGSDTAPYLLKDGIIKLDRSAPVAQNTIFGWVLSGNVGSAPKSTFKIHNFRCQISDALRRFWEIEEVPSAPVFTKEETACEQHFKNTHSRQSDGRYVVKLPFNQKQHLLGESKNQALRRLYSLERKFKRFPLCKEAYIQFMREYEQLGHMEKVSTAINQVRNTFYLPHHYVLKAESTTTKQRTVFDGSAKSTTGISVNDALMVGPTVQPDLYTILLKFRYKKIALKGDFAKMYRQFMIAEEERDYQRILWREEESLPVLEYRLATVTYGTACASYLATRCLNQLAEDEKRNFPAAAQVILSSMYVDDLLHSVDTPPEAIELVKQMNAIAATAGMEMRKWCTNEPTVLHAIPEHLREDCDIMEFEDSSNVNSIKALGIRWQPATDNFTFSVNVDTSKLITKRYLLSEISKTFDPIGWLTPVVINAKLLLQKVWLAGKGWDDPVPEQLQDEWKIYIRNLDDVKDVKIPRCIITSTPTQVEIHGFCDSSEVSFASAVYIKCIYTDGSITVHLLTSRSRVAPVKAVSLPKLELCGASLLAETIQAVQKSFDRPHHLFCWTDSTITLRWISAHSRKWKTFVANRVSIIQSLTPPEHWHHVRSEDNPADLPSRGISTQQLINSSLWWHGPSWLKQSTYPMSSHQCNEDEVKKEERAKQIACFHLGKGSSHLKLYSAFSSFMKLCRCTAYLIRFIEFLKKKKLSAVKGALTVAEIHSAKRKLIVWAQSVSFTEEYHQLQRFGKINTSSKLLQFTPYIDGHGLIRVGGRIQKSNLPANTRHPIIIPHNHHLTTLLIHDAHHFHLHSGFTLTFTVLRREYWILRGRDIVRNYIRKCIICKRAKATTTQQLMGNLPHGRVNASRAFLHTGVDFAGPFATKIKKGRHFSTEKSYFAIFVCLATKAIHLEAVTSLSTESFIACYERFISRRGICAHVYSDCGTNFVGANRILNEFLQAQQSQLKQQFSTRGTTWHFNPPASPHQGGLWEAGVKAVKHHFYRVVGQRILFLEQFQTLLCKIEACLNSRPLCALSSDPTDVDVLTPGHFLIGEPLTNIPEPDVSIVKENRLSHWESVRQLTQNFWKRWSNEYLTSLQMRHKWTEKRDNIQPGDLVVIADDQVPVAKWKLGRVITAHTGVDGLVRSATVKTSFGELKRPITKLSPLISINEQN